MSLCCAYYCFLLSYYRALFKVIDYSAVPVCHPFGNAVLTNAPLLSTETLKRRKKKEAQSKLRAFTGSVIGANESELINYNK